MDPQEAWAGRKGSSLWCSTGTLRVTLKIGPGLTEREGSAYPWAAFSGFWQAWHLFEQCVCPPKSGAETQWCGGEGRVGVICLWEPQGLWMGVGKLQLVFSYRAGSNPENLFCYSREIGAGLQAAYLVFWKAWSVSISLYITCKCISPGFLWISETSLKICI